MKDTKPYCRSSQVKKLLFKVKVDLGLKFSLGDANLSYIQMGFHIYFLEMTPVGFQGAVSIRKKPPVRKWLYVINFIETAPWQEQKQNQIHDWEKLLGPVSK